MKQKEEIYEINNKKYTVITNYSEDNKNTEKIYDILCELIISKITEK